MAGTDRHNFRAAVVIPCLAERDNLPLTLASLASNPAERLAQTLIVVVVNNRADVCPQQLGDNQQTLAWLQSRPFAQLNLAWVDASSDGLALPDKDGVGLARKIGFDLCLAQLNWEDSPLLISLDADTLVDQHYLPAIFDHFQASQAGAATIPFRHQCAVDPRQEAAIRHYELYLRSYLFGLQCAGSPYAYHTIGSAFACRASDYIGAGGMNRRQAGEDFYFLQQLAKTCGVMMLSGTLVQPSARFSGRVPFGTGKAVQGQVEEDRPLFQFSSAAAFAVLQDWLSLLAESLDLPAAVVLQRAGVISLELQQFLRELNFASAWQKLQSNHGAAQQRQAALHCWFDGLRTRQLLSRLDADQRRPAEELVAELLTWGGLSGAGSKAESLALLEGVQHAGPPGSG